MRQAVLAVVLLASVSLNDASARAAPIAFTDPIGDANFINDQGTGLPAFGDGVDSRPASLGSADLMEARYQTTYISVPESDDEGRVVAIRRIPTGLRVRLRTLQPPTPTFGPTVATELWAEVEGCPLIFRSYSHGLLSQPDDPPETAQLRTRSTSCPEGAKTYASGIDLDIRGTVAIMTFPFAALTTTNGPVLRPGALIRPDPGGSGATTASIHRAPTGVLVAGPFIDTARPEGTFEIGSDLPPDVECSVIPSYPECGADGPPDTGEDLHDALLASGPPARVVRGEGLDLGEEFAVASFRPDGAWRTYAFDVARAGLEGTYVEINLGARLVRDGVVNEDWLPISESFAQWKLFYGPAHDPYRTVTTLSQDTPYGITISLPSAELDRLTLLAGADVEAEEDVGFVLALRGNEDGFVGEPFPDQYGAWIASWTEGKQKVRLVPDRWGEGVLMAARLSEHGGITPYEARRDVLVEDERRRVAGIAEPGSMRTVGELMSTGPALADASLFYIAQADQSIVLEWRTPHGSRRGERSSTVSSGASLFATAPASVAGPHRLSLDVASGAESSSSLSYIQTLWSLDAEALFPGLEATFTSDPAAPPIVIEPGERVSGEVPALVVSVGPR